VQYRSLGAVSARVSALGFGCMRLPTTGENANIDEPLATQMLRHAIDQGVNYVDTAYGYHGGNSERLVGRALRDGYRERVLLATKLPHWNVQTYADMDRILNEQLERLQTDHIDAYLLHSLDRAAWTKLFELGVLGWAEGALRDGRIRYLGFSFHDTWAVFKEIVDASDLWSFCQIQYNYMDVDENPGTRGLEYAAARGLGVVVMEPLLGGKLVNPPAPVQALWDESPTPRSAPDWGLQWVWNHSEVGVVLSGMSTMQHVVENLASASHSGPGTLTAEDLALVERVRATYRDLCPIPCTGCQYCMPCPNGVEIPRNFGLLNQGVMYNTLSNMRERYARMPEDQRASACIGCRECEDKCPQHILISEEMPRVHAVLGEGQSYSCSTGRP